MPDFTRGKIYLIRNKLDEKVIYVGSTTEKYLSTRLCKHKSQPHCSLNQYINENNQNWSDYYIELYEEFPCENKLQLCKKENEIIRKLGTINKFGYRTEEIKMAKEKEYREKNREKINEKSKEYNKKNRDIILMKKKEYNEKTKEHKREYMKERYQVKKEELKQKQKDYVEKNKLEVNKRKREQASIKISCECGCIVRRDNMKEHEKTKKHNDLIKKLSIEII